MHWMDRHTDQQMVGGMLMTIAHFGSIESDNVAWQHCSTEQIQSSDSNHPLASFFIHQFLQEWTLMTALKLSQLWNPHRACNEKSTKISSSENALHRMIGRVTWRCSPSLIARCTQVIVVTDQTFVTLASKVALHTRITADTCITSNVQVVKPLFNLYGFKEHPNIVSFTDFLPKQDEFLKNAKSTVYIEQCQYYWHLCTHLHFVLETKTSTNFNVSINHKVTQQVS